MTQTRLDLVLKAALAGLDPEERQAAAQASAVDPDFVHETQAIELMLGGLLQPAREEAPPEALFGRIEAALQSGKVFERLNDGAWSDMLPGIRMKPIAGSGVVLLRCAPGAVIPAHRHPIAETMIVLAGDLTVEGAEFFVGDVQTHAAGSEHAEATTRGGCLIALLCAA